MRVVISILVVFGMCFSVGCRQDDDSEAQSGLEAYGRLPGLKETPRTKLRDELDRIVDEQGTPELLMGTEITEITDAQNVAAGLKDLFPSWRIESILEDSAGLLPKERFEFNVLNLKKVGKFQKKYDQQRRQARQALARPQCNFGIRHVVGFAADTSFIDVVRICARLEAFCAAEALADGKPAEAIRAFGYMLRLAACLGAEKHVPARLETVLLRAEAFSVLQAIVRHQRLTQKQLGQLYRTVQAHLNAWPDDADAWIGDRALGMYLYEVVRDGNIRLVLTPEDISEFDKEGTIAELAEAARETVDDDELYYLQTMREVIDRCRKPYYTRATLAADIEEDMKQIRNTPEYPLVADRFLLRDLGKGLLLQAQDRAACEAWAVALAEALGLDHRYSVNPVTGKKYRVEKQGNWVALWVVPPETDQQKPHIEVPVLSD